MSSPSHTSLSPAHVQPPYYLRHHDLEYAIVPIDLETSGCVVEECDGIPEEGYLDVREDEERGKGFVRILRDPMRNEYIVYVLYSPWPAYTPDPYRSNAPIGQRGTTLSDALQGVHRLFAYYKQEVRHPLPFLGSWVDYRLTTTMIDVIQQEALLQGIGARER